MDEKQAPARPSGLPRPSRLPVSRLPAPKPVPKPAPAVRPAPSREGLNSGLRNPRLRPAASRDQLNSAPAPKKPEPRPAPTLRREIPPPSLRRPEARVPSLKSVRSVPRLNANEPTYSKPPTPPEDKENASLSRPTSSTRRPFEPSVTLPSDATPEVPPLPRDVSPPAVDDAHAEADSAALQTPIEKSYKPRPSLAERTMETLAQLPSSPALSKKPSSFFDPEGASRPRSRAESGNSRPGSSYASDGSVRPASRHSRPGSSSGAEENPFANNRGAPTTYRPLGADDQNDAASISLRAPLFLWNSFLQQPEPDETERHYASPKTGATTTPARPLKTSVSVNGLFKKASLPALKQTPAPLTSTPQKATPKLKSAKSYGALRKPTPTKIGLPPPAPVDGAEPSDFRKSSATLRDQIAKARAAKRAADRQATEAAAEPETVPEEAPEVAAEPAATISPATEIEPPIVPADEGFDFGIGGIGVALTSDPFNTRRSENAQNKIIQQRVGAGRSTGRLNIAALGLRTIPDDVLKMYDMESIGAYDGSWAESVDLTRFVAADNDIEVIDDRIFPDVTPEQMAEDEDSNGNIFGGLEAMDLHGNSLISLPMGLRQLRLLTSLNLSQNRLANNCLEVITEVTPLRDLKLANNLLYGPLDSSFSKLQNLEIFDLHGNNVSSLPEGIENLSRLRILNLSDNSFESLPFANLAKLPLTELVANKNKLSGTLIEQGVEALSNLQMLDLSSNQITHLVASGSTIRLPSVHQIVLSMNRLKELPDVTSWTALMTLTANENAIQEFPTGFTKLEKLRNVDFTSNDIRVVPPEISRMDNLTMIRLSGNPLRDKKFVSATTEELKEVLAGRLEPPPPYQDASPESDAAAAPEVVAVDEIAEGFGKLSIKDAPPVPPIPADEEKDDNASDDDFATPPTSSKTSPARARSQTLSKEVWPVKQGGILDRSNTKSSSLHPVVCSRVAADNKVLEIQLHHNLFTCFPNSLSFFAETLAALSLAHNQLVGETYLTEELDLPALRELNLVSNHITSLSPLTSHLKSPQLEKMDVSLNRITALPSDLRSVFPRLVVLLAANNHLIELDPDTIKGLEVIDAGNNDIAHLNPRIGLLGGSGGLKRLEVSGNRFRVPRYSVLERGTDATLRWLRGRVPVAEMASWRETQGGDGNISDTSLADVD